MRRMLLLTLFLLLLSACAVPAEETESSAPPLQEAPEEPAPAEASPEEEVPVEEVPSEDHVLLALDAPLADGRTLRLEAVGKRLDEYSAGVREVRVYDGDALIQTILSREVIEAEWDEGMTEAFYNYTECWSPEESMEVLDLNFDGSADFGLFGWICNNTIPYYYWIWDAETEQYQYAFTLQGAEARPEAQEATAEYKSGSAGSQWITEVYKPDKNGDLYLVRVERDTCDFEPEPPSYLDFDRGWAHEIWLPPQEAEPIRPDEGRGILEEEFVLIYREVPVYEADETNPGSGEGTVSHFTEIWELKDGELQLTSREEYTDENRQ